MQVEGCAAPRCFKRLSCTQADRPFRCLRYVLATAVHRAADAVHDEAAIGIAGMEIADSCRYLHAFPRQGGAFEFQTIRSEEHTSELQSLMRISYAVFCLKKKNIHK